MKNLKHFASITFSAIFLWTHMVMSASPAGTDSVTIYRDLYKSAVAKKPKYVLVEMYEQIKKDLPYEYQREMDYRLKNMNPHLINPEFDVVGEGKNKTVRFRFNEGKNSMTVQISEGGYMDIVGSANGKSFRQKIAPKDFQNPLDFLKLVSGVRRTITRKVPTVQLYNYQQYSALTDADKKAYVDRLRSILELAEKSQNEFAKSASKKAVKWSPLGEVSWAAGPSGDCIVAGWQGSYSNGRCGTSEGESNEGGQRCKMCNPTVYGDTKQCIPYSDSRLPLDATAQCNERTKNDKYAAFDGVKNRKDFDEKMARLSPLLTSMEERCKEIQGNSHEKTPDQNPTCTAFDERLKELAAANCKLLQEDKSNRFKDLQCVEKEFIDDPPTPPVGEEVGDAERCKGLPTRANCGSGTAVPLRCAVGPGKIVTKYYCECGPGASPRMRNTIDPVGCDEKVVQDQPRDKYRDYDDDRSYRRKKRERREESGFLGMGWEMWAALGLVAAVGIYAFMQVPKAQPWQTPVYPTPATPVPPPQTVPTSTGTTQIINTR